MRRLSPIDAAAEFHRTDSLGLPLGPAQPAALLEAMGTRKDWEDLRIFGALITVLTELFNHPNVHYLSGFFGPLERLLRDSGANIGFAPADFRRFIALLADLSPRVMATAAAPPDRHGTCSLSLHAGANVAEIHRAGADPDRVLMVEVSDHYPVTYGLGEHTHRAARRRDRRAHRVAIVALRDRRPGSATESSGPSPGTSPRWSPTGPPSRPASARCPRWWPHCWPRATAATTASTPRCSPPG